jgi:cardiolipin synthase
MWQSSNLGLVILDVALSAMVTAHVLLHKRNVNSAIGWIGLAWLSPFVGTFLYFGFGINRVQRRARILRRSAKRPRGRAGASALSSEPFSNLKATVGALTHNELATATISLPLHNGDNAYPQMLQAIKSATTSIALASYIFRSDRIGSEFMEALATAIERGVTVRVLVDGFGSGMFLARSYHAFRKRNIPIARFMHSIAPWRVQYLNLRLHKKILIVDGVLAFIGGLNIADENMRRRRQKIRVRDTHFKIEGPVVKQITMDFINDWHFATGEELQEAIWNPSTQQAGPVEARVIVSGPDQDAEQLTLVLLAAIGSAQKSIRIATPYFLPGEQLMTALILATTRGVDVQIVIPMVNNHRLMGWAMLAHVGPLLQAGCHVWRAPLPFDHSKLMVVDNEWCFFGSPNWDTRSLRLNFEMAIEAYDPELANQMTTIIDQNHGTPLTMKELEARSYFAKFRDAATRLLTPYL